MNSHLKWASRHLIEKNSNLLIYAKMSNLPLKQQSSLFNINVAVFILVTKIPFLFQSPNFFLITISSILRVKSNYVDYLCCLNLACMYGALLKPLVSSIWLVPWKNGVIRSNRISIYIHAKFTFDP